MKSFKKLFLVFGVMALIIFSSCNCTRAQSIYTYNASKTATNLFKGCLVVDSMTRYAVRDTTFPSNYPTRYREGSIVYRDADSSAYYFNGNKWFRNSRETIYVTATLDFGSAATLVSKDLTISVTGAALGDLVTLGIPNLSLANSCFTAFVSAANTVTVRFNNYSSGSLDPASGIFNVMVTKQ